MNVNFHIHYRTNPGQQLAIQYWQTSGEEHELLLNSYDEAHWIGNLELSQIYDLHYRYVVLSEQSIIHEAEPVRSVNFEKDITQYHIQDQWRAYSDKKRIFNSAAFSEILLRREPRKKSSKKKVEKVGHAQLQIRLNAPDIPADASIAIVGNTSELGEWKKPSLLEETNFPEWQITIPWKSSSLAIEYKFVLCDNSSGEIVDWEAGDNRSLQFHFAPENNSLLIASLEGYRFANNWWRAAGVAIPVFALRSKAGMGIGEFLDLKSLADFSSNAGLKMIQVLPVNDTIASKTWVDSYPYAAISVFALHPLYINIPAIASFNSKKDLTTYNKVVKRLNDLPQIDFEEVLKHKFHFLNILYQQKKEEVLKSRPYKIFYKKNAFWLDSYAAFSYLRDTYGTPNFNQWPKHTVYSQQEIKNLCKLTSAAYDKIAFYYFIQFYADQQLKEAKHYAGQKGIVLKGDLPIGIYRYSADAWVAPELYNMEEQAGAPPDDYAVLGQNWGFPTYNWAEMAKDNFGWWQKRMQQLAEYFDALRIDHILGFFRIWQIPLDQVFGTLGLFNPRIPYAKEELAQFGLLGDLDKYTLPFIDQAGLTDAFGAQAAWVKKTFLDAKEKGIYSFKSDFDNQIKIQDYFESKVTKKYQPFKKGVLELATEVLLIEEPGSAGLSFNPRITLNTTRAYSNLDAQTRAAFDRVYNDYFFKRHDEFWKAQAEWKLPALLDATDMLICGEDLGMIPASVPGVMQALNIIPLEIQRMPKGDATFGVPHQYPYFSVCSPSCHDMSTIRGWWEGDAATAQRFYNEHLQRFGEASKSCSKEIVFLVNQEHLDAPSILAIIPIQDLVGMDDELKLSDAFAEQINDPSNSKHYWRYRFHINMEELKNKKDLLDKVRKMVKRSGRQLNN